MACESNNSYFVVFHAIGQSSSHNPSDLPSSLITRISANLKATAILSQRDTWVSAVSVVAWPQYTQDFLKDHKGLTEIDKSRHLFIH